MLFVSSALMDAEDCNLTTSQNAISEDSSLPLTQMPASAHHSGTPSHSIPEGLDFLPVPRPKRKRSAKKGTLPRFTDFAIDHWRVTRFICKVMQAILPKQLLGTEDNMMIFEKCGLIGRLGSTDEDAKLRTVIEKFVSARRNETFSMNIVMRDFKVSACTWAVASGPKTRPTMTASLLQRQLVENLLYWILEHLVVDLLKVSSFLSHHISHKLAKERHPRSISTSQNLPPFSVGRYTSYNRTGTPSVGL